MWLDDPISPCPREAMVELGQQKQQLLDTHWRDANATKAREARKHLVVKQKLEALQDEVVDLKVQLQDVLEYMEHKGPNMSDGDVDY